MPLVYFVPGSRTHHNPTAKHAITLLEESIRQYGKPEQVLTDRGTQFHPARGGISEFTQFCTGKGIQHIVRSVRRPSTIGKIEAFHKAYTIEASIYPTHKEFVNYWNYERTHQGIGYLYPADVHFRNLTHHSGQNTSMQGLIYRLCATISLRISYNSLDRSRSSLKVSRTLPKTTSRNWRIERDFIPILDGGITIECLPIE